uniref:Uncharacterized protein n=1 Tax=viral metagenome TaxID=1070528 RepID=A0A6C0CLP1_9ZZZZ
MPYEKIDTKQNWNTFCTAHWQKILPTAIGITFGIDLNKLININPENRTLQCFANPGAPIVRRPGFVPEEV